MTMTTIRVIVLAWEPNFPPGRGKTETGGKNHGNGGYVNDKDVGTIAGAAFTVNQQSVRKTLFWNYV